MSSIKRLSFIILFLLIMLSIMDDLSKQSTEQEVDVPEVHPHEIQPGIAHIKVKPGDTIISKTKEINNVSRELHPEKIIYDFQKLNPGVDVDALIPHSFYYFPLYNE